MKWARTKSCVIFMPRIDLWAVEEDVKIAEKTNSCSMDRLSSEMDTSCFTPREIIEKENGTNTGKHPAEMIECQFDKKASYDWMTFIEQKEFEMKFFWIIGCQNTQAALWREDRGT